MIDSWSGKGKHVELLEAGHLEFKDVHFRYPTRYYLDSICYNIDRTFLF